MSKEIKNMEDVMKVKESDVKRVFVEALEVAKNKVKELEEARINPKVILKEKKNKEIVEVAEKVMEDTSLTTMIQDLRTTGTTKLEDIAQKISSSTEEYQNIVEAIKIKNKELSELYTIDEKLLDLAAIINAGEQTKISYESDYQKAREREDIYMSEKEDYLKSRIEEVKSEIRELEKKSKSEIAKREEEWEYEFHRREIKAFDTLQDKLNDLRKSSEEEIAVKNKEILEKGEALSKKEQDLKDKETYILDLEKQVSEIPTKISEEVKKTQGIEKGKYESSLKREKEILEKDKTVFEAEFNAKMQVKDNKITMLTEIINNNNNEIIDLKNKLDAAYDKIESISNAAVNASRPMMKSQENK